MRGVALLTLLAAAKGQRYAPGDPRCEPKVDKCKLDDLKVLCTCHGEVETRKEITPVVLYITPLVDDTGISFYYNQVRVFLETFMLNINKLNNDDHGEWTDFLKVKLVHPKSKSEVIFKFCFVKAKFYLQL